MNPQFGPDENGRSDPKYTLVEDCWNKDPAGAMWVDSSCGRGGANGSNHASESIITTVEYSFSAAAIAGNLQ